MKQKILNESSDAEEGKYFYIVCDASYNDEASGVEQCITSLSCISDDDYE